jgi:hypothetical protein
MVYPLDPEIAATILAVGLFVPDSYMGWKRVLIEDNGDAVAVHALLQPDNNALRFEIAPAVSQYNQHAMKRIAAGVYFEVAAKYAEKVDGQIKQFANVVGCTEGGMAEHVLAQYPDVPLMWERVCAGFREAILGGVA